MKKNIIIMSVLFLLLLNIVIAQSIVVNEFDDETTVFNATRNTSKSFTLAINATVLSGNVTYRVINSYWQEDVDDIVGESVPSAYIDGDFSTKLDVGTHSFQWTYVKPNGTYKALWRHKNDAGTRDIHIPESCFDYNQSFIYINSTSDFNAPAWVDYTCRNTSNVWQYIYRCNRDRTTSPITEEWYNGITYVTSSGASPIHCFGLYEEAMNWTGVTTDFEIYINSTKVYNQTGNLTGTSAIDLNTTVLQNNVNQNETIDVEFKGSHIFLLELSNLSVAYTRLLQLNIFDEETDKRITDNNLTITITSSDFARNWTIDKGQINITDIPNGDISIIYGGGTYATRSYFTTISGFQTILDLYTAKSSNTSLILFDVVDEKGRALFNSTLKAQGYFIDENVYKVVAMEHVDENGEAAIYLIPNTKNYIFIVEKNGTVIFRSDPRKIFTNLIQLQANVLVDALESHIKEKDITTNLSWNNATKEVSYFFNDPTGIVVTGCLKVIKQTMFTETTLGPNCTTSSSATIIMDISNHIQNNTRYAAHGYLTTSTTYSTLYTDILPDFVKPAAVFQNFGNLGLYLGLIFILTMFFIGLPNFTVAVGYSVLSLIVLSLVGLSYFGSALIISISIIGILIARVNRI